MPINRQNSDTAAADYQTVSPTRIFEIFSRRRRQLALEYLSGKAGAIPLGDLAEFIVVIEGEPTRDRYERVLTDLIHCELPKMADAGVLQYDLEDEWVELTVKRAMLTPYLELADRTHTRGIGPS